MNNNYRIARLRCGLSIELAAEGIGVQPELLHEWEIGVSEPFAEDLRKMSEFYKQTPDYLLGMVELQQKEGKSEAGII